MNDKFRFGPRADLKNYREALRQMLEGGWVLPRDLMPSGLNAVVAPVDVLDHGNELLIKINLPGARPEDVSVSVLGSTLTIKASLGEDDDMRGATYLRRERKASEFVRSLTLPVSVEAEHAQARFQYGVLTLVLPKSASMRPRVIKVEPD